jgi:hypothetical protein
MEKQSGWRDGLAYADLAHNAHNKRRSGPSDTVKVYFEITTRKKDL